MDAIGSYWITNWYGDCNWDNNDKEPFFDLMMEYDYKPDVQLFRVPFYNTIATSNNSTVPTKDPNQTYNIDIPKTLAPINSTTFIDIILDDLIAQGFKRIIFATGYHSDKIEGHIKNRTDAKYIISKT